mmetsp:Transcript_52087/g.161631  ORF Transcript_52087/g.161631 Transcript_52087/m.161631 type:complete len:632 (+) Transcript_52087:127-2022(+)
MSLPENVPYPGWGEWWRTSPFFISLAAGAIAGMSAEFVFFPLDCVKTRVQSRHGFKQAGGFRGIYRGCGIAISGAAPASAIFFSTYECSKHALKPDEASDVDTLSTGRIVLASVIGELFAACVRVPVDVMKQRLQAGYRSSFSLPLHSSIVLASFQATAMRDVTHSSLQYPLYESLKRLAAGQCDGQMLPTWLAAVCGSVAGVVSATLTTPFDLVKTRLNLRTPPALEAGGPQQGRMPRSAALVGEEIRQIYSSRGVAGFFAGAGLRALWMGLGGFVFLGSFELAKDRLCRAAEARRLAHERAVAQEALVAPVCAPAAAAASQATARPAPPPRAPAAPEPSASVSFAAGLVAGVAVDVPLHPVDTLKTRLQAREGFVAAGGMRSLWSGLSAVLIMSVPGSAVFFVVYEEMQHLLKRHATGILGNRGASEGHFSQLGSVWRDAVSASVADISACAVRVPCEVVKQRMQTRSISSAPPSVLGTVRSVAAEGLVGFYAGFGATVSREVPFALIQMPLFEALKLRHPWTVQARRNADTTTQGLIGMMSGGLAGAVAGALTTPVDAAKTRIMLTARRADRCGLLETLSRMRAESGLRGLFSGVAPRTLQCGAGGALWLGAFEWSKLLLGGAAREAT